MYVLYYCTYIHVHMYEADVNLMYNTYVPESPPLGCFKELKKKTELQMGTACTDKYDMIEMIGIRKSLWLAPPKQLAVH